MAEDANTTPTPIARRRRGEPATNVVTLPKRPSKTDAIVAEVRDRGRRESEALSRRMQQALIGQRLLGARARS